MADTAAPRLVDRLFRLRAQLLRLAVDPIDRGLRAFSGKSHWPPFSLRRHVGPVARFETAALQTRAWVERFGLVRAGDAVLDLGCGCGVMAPLLLELIGSEGRYLGIDVHRPAIDWCRSAYREAPNLSFALAEVSSPYGLAAGPPITEYRFPVADAAIDFSLAKSLFTHLREAEARHYLQEIRRVLRPGGRALISVFLFSRDLAGEELLFRQLPFPAQSDAPVRFRSAAKPEAAVAFDGETFRGWIAEAGLELADFVPIFWPGKISIRSGQDLLILAAPRQTPEAGA